MGSVPVLEALLLEDLPKVIQTLYNGRAVWNGTQWQVSDIPGTPSVRLTIEGHDQTRLGHWTDQRPAANPSSGDIFALIARTLGTDIDGALQWARDFTVHRPTVSQPTFFPHTQAGQLLAPAHPRSLSSATGLLLKNEPALAFLLSFGLIQQTILHFSLGLTQYNGGESDYTQALCFPVLDPLGTARRKRVRLHVPGLTQNTPASSEAWATGPPDTYWVTPAAGRTSLFVCGTAWESWRLWQVIQNTALADRLCIITRTHGSALPERWKSAAFWQTWDRVYLGHDADEAGDRLAWQIHAWAGRDVHQVWVPEGLGSTWTDYFQRGQTAAQFETLLQEARILDFEVRPQPIRRLPQQAGLHAAVPVDVSSAYVNGHLYVPFRVLERQVEEHKAKDGKVQENVLQRYRTMVLRSDGVVCTFAHQPAPRGTPREDLVLALNDGTIISREPVIDEARATFSLAGITRFREARQRRPIQSAMTVTPQEMLTQVHEHLKRAVVLPYPEDYALLTFVVLTSYAQPIFDAVPLVLIVGPAGSGKTALGLAMATVGCNASIISGQTTAAAAARMLDHLHGLAVFDDLEQIGKRSANGEFGEFVQQLKVSYKKDTATKTWTNTRTMRVEKLDFYGVKVITNTRGAGEILSTRMLHVQSREVPKDALASLVQAAHLSGPELQNLRDNLHVWVMENVHRIDRYYRTHHADHRNRQAEITAPLRVLSALIDHPVLTPQLLAALNRQDREPAAMEMAAADRVRGAVVSLVEQGYQERISVKHLMLEMRRLTVEDGSCQHTTETPEWQEPRWVGRTLRAEGLVNSHAPEERPRLWGQQTRLVALDQAFVARTLGALAGRGIAPPLKQPLEFCLPQPCHDCPYGTLCDMRPAKEKKLGQTHSA
ncbi:hypothetical protein [Deinococcus humi]|uniref:Uncharacterized protein n=1 Tax=Deinococcus humi TaxID=662880 RepID=A0A7W8K0K1_9DEIO|nr:hypothetical protein [Deinococcus humi]MBB5366278.1 hypothetical protein [Deinococcus humi]GGO41147.1 hypothetical protein GCM10008949_51540 [Deinococcus humi]